MSKWQESGTSRSQKDEVIHLEQCVGTYMSVLVLCTNHPSKFDDFLVFNNRKNIYFPTFLSYL